VARIGEDFFDLLPGFFGAAGFEVELGELDTGAAVRMAVGDLFENSNGTLFLAKGAQCFGERHQGMPVIVLRIRVANPFEQRQRFFKSVLPQKALPEVRSRVFILRIAFYRGPVGRLGFFELALL